MPARQILIVYGTSYGQTAKIARFMANLLTASGDAVTLVNADELRPSGELPRGRRPRDFDGAIIGGSVLYGRHQRCVGRFVRANRDALNAMPSDFFSVLGPAGTRDDAKLYCASRLVDEFLYDTGWRPGRTETVAGAMTYTKYGPLLRWIVKRISAKTGGPTDSSRDHELTDWEQVRRFVEGFAGAVPQKREAQPLAAV